VTVFAGAFIGAFLSWSAICHFSSFSLDSVSNAHLPRGSKTASSCNTILHCDETLQ